MTRGSVITAALLIVLLVGFAALTLAIVGGRTIGFDRSLLLALRSPAPTHLPLGSRWVQEAARDVTALGGFTVLTLVTVIAATLLTIRRRWRAAVVLVAAAIGAQVTAETIKHYVNRPRPLLVPHLDLVYSTSFPSGHAVMSPTVYFTLAALVSATATRSANRLVVFGMATLVVAAIGVSRVYMGVHWPSDVLGGWMLGAVFALTASCAARRWEPILSPQFQGARRLDAPAA